MATSASLASQTQFQMEMGSPLAYVTIFEGVSISGFGIASDLIEATHFQSLAKEYIYGLPDTTEMTIQCNYDADNATHLAWIAAQSARVAKNMKLVWPNSEGTFSFAGLVLGWSFDTLTPNAVRMITFRVKPTGAFTFA